MKKNELEEELAKTKAQLENTDRALKEAAEAYEAETLSTAELMAENARLQKCWDSDSTIFAGALQLLKEAGLAPGSRELIAASERFYAPKESQRKADESDDEKPLRQEENAGVLAQPGEASTSTTDVQS